VKDYHERTHSKNLDILKYLVDVDGEPRYSCPKCSVHYETSSLLKKHMEKNCRAPKTKRVYRYPCAHCSRNFTTKIQAARHMFNLHQINIENVEKFCFECNEEFDDYVNHIRIHSCNFSCSFCGSKFLTQDKVTKHEESKHSTETDESRPFKCYESECDARFKTLNHLKSHQQAFHIQQNKEFKCPECDKVFGLKAHLTVHVRQHFASFPCNFKGCNRLFKKLNNLKNHFEREHGILDIYLCGHEGCPVRFKMLVQLKEHRETDHGISFNTHKYFENF
jgi:KRAB domain-containing zinc finger protein